MQILVAQNQLFGTYHYQRACQPEALKEALGFFLRKRIAMRKGNVIQGTKCTLRSHINDQISPLNRSKSILQNHLFWVVAD